MTCRKLLRSSTRRCFPRTGKFRLVLETIWTYEVVSSERCESRYSLALGLQPERLDPGNETNLWNSKSLAKTARRIEASGAYLDSRRYPTMNLLYDILSLRPDILSLSVSVSASFVIVRASRPFATRSDDSPTLPPKLWDQAGGSSVTAGRSVVARSRSLTGEREIPPARFGGRNAPPRIKRCMVACHV